MFLDRHADLERVVVSIRMYDCMIYDGHLYVFPCSLSSKVLDMVIGQIGFLMRSSLVIRRNAQCASNGPTACTLFLSLISSDAFIFACLA